MLMRCDIMLIRFISGGMDRIFIAISGSDKIHPHEKDPDPSLSVGAVMH